MNMSFIDRQPAGLFALRACVGIEQRANFNTAKLKIHQCFVAEILDEVNDARNNVAVIAVGSGDQMGRPNTDNDRLSVLETVALLAQPYAG